MEKPKRTLRLKGSHPTMKKFNDLCEYADKLGITLSWSEFPHRVELYEKNKKSTSLLMSLKMRV